MPRIHPVVIMLTAVPGVAFPAGSGTVPSLLTNSPFLPPGFQPPGGAQVTSEVPVSSSQFEFHGVYQLDGVYYFNLYNKRESRGNWISQGKPVDGFPRIVRYNRDEDLLMVELAGESISLELVQTEYTPTPLPSGTVPRQVTRPASPTGSPQVSPARRRVIRPTSRSQSSGDVRRPVIQPRTPNQ